MNKFDVIIPLGFNVSDVDVRRIFMKDRQPGLTDYHVETNGPRELLPIFGRRAGIATALKMELQQQKTRTRIKHTALAFAIRTALNMFAPKTSPLGNLVSLATVEHLEGQILVLTTHIQNALKPMDGQDDAERWFKQSLSLLNNGVPLQLVQRFVAIGADLKEYHRLTRQLQRQMSTGLPHAETLKEMAALLPADDTLLN